MFRPHAISRDGECGSFAPGPTLRTDGPLILLRQPLHLVPLELPRGEATDVDVELIEPRIVAITSKLNLELQLTAPDRKITHRTRCIDTWPAPCAIRESGRELPCLDHCSGFLAESSRLAFGGLQTRTRAV